MIRIGLFLSVTFATLAPAATEWTYGSSDHFEVYTTGGAGKAREALNYFERIHSFFSDVLKINPDTKAPTRLIIFSNDKEFSPYRPNEGTFAYYQPGPDRDYIVMRSLSSEVYRVVVHEYMHLVVKHGTNVTLPLWLNEGWADFYSTVENRGGKMAVGGPPPDRVAQMILGPKLMPLEKLFSVDHNSPEYNDRERMTAFYSQSWALTHMLLADSKYYPESGKFLGMMLDGKDSIEAMTTAYGRSLSLIASDLNHYITSGQFVLRLFDYKSPKARKDLETRETSQFEASLVTANLQAVSVRGENDARAAFTRLEKENEGHLELQESFGTFEYRRGHREAAAPHFARAQTLGSTNWQLYRDYAYAVADEAQREALLGKANDLNPADLDTRLRYSDILLRNRKPAQSLAALVPVKSVDHEHAFQLFQMLARANAANGHADEAKIAARRAVEAAATDQEKDYAARLLQSLDRPVVAMRTPQPARPATPPRADEDDDAPSPASDALGERPRLARAEQRLEPRGLSDTEVAALNRATLVNNSKVVLEARFQTLDCNAETPVLVFTTSTGALRLALEDPQTVLLRGAGAETVSMNCGDQRNRSVRVGYNPENDAKLRTTGDVRFLEFR